MTSTDIGILLIVLCVLLWAIMAALHRHTVQLKALREQLEKLREESGATHTEDAGATEDTLASRQPEQPANRIFGVSRKS